MSSSSSCLRRTAPRRAASLAPPSSPSAPLTTTTGAAGGGSLLLAPSPSGGPRPGGRPVARPTSLSPSFASGGRAAGAVGEPHRPAFGARERRRTHVERRRPSDEVDLEPSTTSRPTSSASSASEGRGPVRRVRQHEVDLALRECEARAGCRTGMYRSPRRRHRDRGGRGRVRRTSCQSR